MPLPFAMSHMLYTHTSMKPGVEGGTPKLRGHKARKIFSESPRSAAVVFLLAFLSVHACVLCLPSPPPPPPLSLSFDTSRMKTFQIDRAHLCGAQSSCQSCHYTTLISNSLFFSDLEYRCHKGALFFLPRPPSLSLPVLRSLLCALSDYSSIR